MKHLIVDAYVDVFRHCNGEPGTKEDTFDIKTADCEACLRKQVRDGFAAIERLCELKKAS